MVIKLMQVVLHEAIYVLVSACVFTY